MLDAMSFINLGPLTDRVAAARVRFGRFLRILGPGLITGAADDDPSGIATYSQTGAKFGFGQLWMVLFLLPLMTAVQEACARIGAVTGRGLASNVKQRFNPHVLHSVVLLVVIANTINIGADLGAMAAATQLVIPLPFGLLAAFYTLVIMLSVVFISYKNYARILKWLALTLIAYPATALIVNMPWAEVVRATFTINFEFSAEYLYMVVAVLGTTISPYLFFWQTSEVVEEEIAQHRLPQKGGNPKLSAKFLRGLRLDTFVGMFVSQITMWFIIITGAAVLHSAGITEITSADQAAKALEPLVQSFPNAGVLAKIIFSTGVVGLGLLAVPVLAGSASYAITEVLGWREGLFFKYRKARGFYWIIITALLVGLLMNFLGINPVTALVFTAVFNGIAAAPLTFIINRIASDRGIMGDYRSGVMSRWLINICFVLMSSAAVALLVSLVF